LLCLVWLCGLALPTRALGQDGLFGQYFDDTELQSFVEGRLDNQVDFNSWRNAPAGTGVTPDGAYSERWTGAVLLDQPGMWTFTTVSNDGVRLSLDGVLRIDDWTSHAAQTDAVSLEMSAGWHGLTLEHYQDGGSMVIQFLFEGPGQPTTIIPGDHLSPFQVTNMFPVVDAGLDKLVVPPDESISLSAAAMDVDGAIVAIQWTQVAGPPVTLVGADQPDLLVDGLLSPGVHSFAVTVWDDAGAMASDTVSVTVAECTSPVIPEGPLSVWRTLTLAFDGPMSSEVGLVNPFLDVRLLVLFTHGDTGKSWLVPGFFAADGRSYDTGASAGDKWQVRFTPAEAGSWTYMVSFRSGADVALSMDPLAGMPLASDGLVGCFEVMPAAADATGFHKRGRVQATGEHYLRTAADGLPFLQGGANSPENLLAYVDFDQTPPTHAYPNHAADWQPGDPTWMGGRGKALIGALNYLASKGMNTVYFLTFNVAGDGEDVWPWTSPGERMRFDCSKLAQWEVVFDHMDRLGIQLHVVTQEQENDTGSPALDGGNLGVERALYYRELVARFGHHLGVVWNLGEENSNTNFQRQQFYDYIRYQDPYDHPIVVHTFPGDQAMVYDPLLMTDRLEGASLQNQTSADVHATTLYWRDRSAELGRPWFIGADETGPPKVGVVPDVFDPTHDGPRKGILWGNLMAGGAGPMWYFGYDFPHDDLDSEDWRQREVMWQQTDHALQFFHDHLPFDQMTSRDDLVDAVGAWCFARPGELYAVYLPVGGATQLDLATSSERYTVSWYDPRHGGGLLPAPSVEGPGPVLITAPDAIGDDWVALVRRLASPPGLGNVSGDGAYTEAKVTSLSP
jgi:hypothetical protein